MLRHRNRRLHSETALRQVLEKILEAGHQTGLDDQFRKARWRPYTSIQMKFLFVCGLILTKSRYPQGEPATHIYADPTENAWIYERMRYSINAFKEAPDLLLTQAEEDSVFIFFRGADGISINEIWTLTVGEVKVWQCLLALTCFFGRITYKKSP